MDKRGQRGRILLQQARARAVAQGAHASRKWELDEGDEIRATPERSAERARPYDHYLHRRGDDSPDTPNRKDANRRQKPRQRRRTGASVTRRRDVDVGSLSADVARDLTPSIGKRSGGPKPQPRPPPFGRVGEGPLAGPLTASRAPPYERNHGSVESRSDPPVGEGLPRE